MSFIDYGDPRTIPNAQNPTLVPNFNPVRMDGEGNAFFVSPQALLAANPRQPANGTITFTGSITTGDTAYIKLTNNILIGQDPQAAQAGAVEVATLCIAGDTLTSIAYRLASLLNANPTLQSYGVTAGINIVSSNPVITISWPGPVGNFTALAGTSGASSAVVTLAGTVVANDTLSLVVGSAQTPFTSAVINMAGSATSGDIVTVNFTNPALTNGTASVSYTVAGGNTLVNIASGLATAINASAALTALGMTANATNTELYMSWTAAYGAIGMAVSASRVATETITLVSQAGSPPSALAPSPAPSELITIGGSVTTGDVLELFISASGAQTGNGATVIKYTTIGGDTTTTIAAALVALINSAPALASTFTATNLANVITVTWNQVAGTVGFTSSVAGATTEQGNVSRSPKSVAISVLSATNATTNATAFKNAVNANVILQAMGFVASSSSGVLTLDYNGGLNPLTVVGNVNGGETAVIGGTVTAGDLLTLTVTDAGLPGGSVALVYKALSTDTTATIATAFNGLINANVNLANIGVTSSVGSSTVTITSLSQNQTTYSKTLSAGATETITLTNLATETFAVVLTVPVQTITVGGSITVGDTLNVIVTDPAIEGGSATVEYTTITADTTTTAATGLAAALNESDLLAAAGFIATSNGAAVTLTPPEPDSSPTLTTWANGAAKLVTLTGTVTTGDVVNIKFTNAKLATGAQNFQYTVLSTDTSLTILATSIASAINADALLAPAGITATSALGVVSLHWAESAGSMTFATSTNGLETATLGGSITATDVITITVTDASVAGSPLAIPYTVQVTDTTNTILAASIAALLEGTTALTAAGINTTSALGVIKMQSKSVTATTYARTLSGGATETLTLAGGPTETSTLSGGPTETLTVANPTAGTETLTPTTPLAGGAGPIIPSSSFTFSQASWNSGSTAALTNFWVGKPVLVDYATLADLIAQGQPII